MKEFITSQGDKFIYKDSVTTGQLLAMQRSIKTKNGIDVATSSMALLNLLVNKIITKDNKEIIESIEIRNFFSNTDSKDGLKLLQLLSGVINEEEDNDPKDPLII